MKTISILLRTALSIVAALVILAGPGLAQSGGTAARPSGFFPEFSGGGDSTAEYFVRSVSPNLTNERVLTFSDNFAITDNGAGNTYTVDLNTVGITDGGTGATTQQGAVNAILNFSGKAAGDMVYFNGTNWVRLPAGSDTQVLTVSSGVPTWSSGSVGAPANARYVVLAADATLSNEEILTGTTNNITVTPSGTNGGNVTLNIGSNVVTLTGTQTLTNKTLTGPTLSWNAGNGVNLAGQTFTSVLNWADWGAARTLTIPDPGTNASFVMTAGAQTIAGVKTFSAAPTLSTGTLTAGANLQTFPSTAQTLVGRTSTDTLTNKTLTSPILGTSLILDQVTQDYTIQWANPAAARLYTIRDVATDAHFAMTATGATYTAGGIGYALNGVLNFSAAGTTGQPLLSQGTGSAPTFGTLGATAGGTAQTTWTTGDLLYASASNTLAKRAIGTTNQVLAVSGGLPTWQSLATLGVSTTVDNGIVEGRLTLVSGDPVGETSSSTTLYYTPYNGNRIALYNGTNWVICTFTQITQALTGLAANTNFDVFIYDSNADGVAETLDIVAWTNATTRATAPVLQDGVYVKSGATGRRFVGTIRTTGSTGTCADSDGGNSAGSRYVCNFYNKVSRKTLGNFATGTSSWTYASNVPRNWNSTGPSQNFVKTGLNGDTWVNASANLNASGANKAYVVINATNATVSQKTQIHSGSGSGDYGVVGTDAVCNVTGFTTISPQEYTDGSTMTFYIYVDAPSTGNTAGTGYIMETMN